MGLYGLSAISHFQCRNRASDCKLKRDRKIRETQFWRKTTNL